ncbi:MAG: hypothetical protein U0470_04310 [Anaerolineae bacterium]
MLAPLLGRLVPEGVERRSTRASKTRAARGRAALAIAHSVRHALDVGGDPPGLADGALLLLDARLPSGDDVQLRLDLLGQAVDRADAALSERRVRSSSADRSPASASVRAVSRPMLSKSSWRARSCAVKRSLA